MEVYTPEFLQFLGQFFTIIGGIAAFVVTLSVVIIWLCKWNL